MLLKGFGWLLICAWTVFAETYEGYYVVKVEPSESAHFKYLNWLENEKDALFLRGARAATPSVEIAMSAETYKLTKDILKSMSLEVVTTDLQKIIAKINPEHRRVTREQDVFDYFKFHPTETIHEFFRTLEIYYPNLLKLEVIGKSYENRELLLAKIGTNSNNNAPKPIVWMDCGIHAREWISPPTCAYISQELLREYNETGSGVLDHLDIRILPVANPDGYDYTFSTNRLWRKTRSKSPQSGCYGVDPNRNFDFEWSDSSALGASNNPCSEIYAGPVALSEPETKAMADYLVSLKPNLRAYFSFHAYGELILHGWGYTEEFPDNVQELRNLGKIMADGFAKERGTRFTIGGAGDALYVATGGSDDFAKGRADARYSYCVELGRNFIMHADEIFPSVRETYQGMKDALVYLASEE